MMETTFKKGYKGSDQTDIYPDFSSQLYRALDDIGVSEEVREGYTENAIALEILETVVYKATQGRDISYYVVGSKYEGTTTAGLNSDLDMLVCDERTPVVENIHDAPADTEALLMLSDKTKPGYVKLQSVFNRTKMTIFNKRTISSDEDVDHRGRILREHYHLPIPNIERHGPADRKPATDCVGEIDYVYAYRSRTIPSFAAGWLHRPMPYNWPSQEQLKRMGSYGCFVVGVGHPESENKETEWRISFSLQERDLMSSLNPTQHKCYVLLKMIKHDIIQPQVGKSLTSYHCKTCIFHLIESRGVAKWTPNDLVPCIFKCLNILLVWVRQEMCPNYFIKEDNLFNKLDKSTLTKLSLVFQDLLSNGIQFLFDFCCDLGKLLSVSNPTTREVRKLLVKDLLDYRNNLFLLIDNTATMSERLSHTKHVLYFLKHKTVVTEHKPTDVQRALDMLIPYIRLLRAQIRCSIELPQIELKQDNKVLQSLIRELKFCEGCDLISSRLVGASLYLQCDKLDDSQEILENCEASLKPYVTSVCLCHDYRRYFNVQQTEKLFAENLSLEEFRRECTAACMVFLPPEANLVPAALRNEMYRSVYTPPGSWNAYDNDWFDWIVVDSKVYLYFLQCILYDRTNNPTNKQKALDNLLHLVNDEYENLGHRETALNLLGWIYIQENRVQDAFDCFRRSLAIRPIHNAARLHIAILKHSLRQGQKNNKRKWSLS